MAGANSNIQITELDFNSIKSNFTTFLQSQDAFKDYNFTGSNMSVLLDVLSYNTQYNAYYLNMVANEMFLDSAVQRPSVISHAKLLNYVPKSAIGPTATINLHFTGVSTGTLTIPAYTNFLSAPINGANYNFVNPSSHTVSVSGGVADFPSIEIKQGTLVNYSYTVNSTTNPTYTFELPDSTVDSTTIQVIVQESSSNTQFDAYKLATGVLNLNSQSKVYFLQESLNNTYEISFGDGIIGKQLKDGNIVRLSYISTEGSAAEGANSFQLLSSVNGFYPTIVGPITAASQGSDKETIDSIKYQAPKSYAAQNRAITKDDYITSIQQNNLGYAFDAVNVWGGEQNNPPVYGQVFISLKPSGTYTLTNTQKSAILENIIKPISVLTVEPKIIDPDYTYVKIVSNVYYDPKKTTLTPNQIQGLVTVAIKNFSLSTLNTFDSTFMASELTAAIKASNPSIITSEVFLQLQKKIYPKLTGSTSYKLDYSVPLERGILLSGISSTPAMQFRKSSDLNVIIDNVYIEEVPTSAGGIEAINVMNPGFNYVYPPSVTILGDGTGATATAVMDGQGSIKSITVTNAGTNYTSAIVQITSQSNDTSGRNGAAVAVLEGRYGTLRSYYNDSTNVKTILNSNIGTVDYGNGIVTLNMDPIAVDNMLGQLTITAKPSSSIVSSSFNKIVTLDVYDPNAITVNVIPKSN